MNKTSKTLLAIALATFTLSFLPYFGDIGYGILRPVGTVAFIMFFITHLLAKEMALFDEEQRQPNDPVLPARNSPAPPLTPTPASFGSHQNAA